MTEKRRYQRSPIEMAASYGIGEDSRPGREAKINNISWGGFCLFSDTKLKIGEEIELAIDLDTSDEIYIIVQVIWIQKVEDSKKYTVGVQIVEKEGLDYDRFIEFYNKQI